jgi:hypothetical protein
VADHCCGGRQRVVVEWEALSLAEKKSGAPYGEVAIAVEDAVKDYYIEPEPSNRPSVVWICDLSDDKTVKKMDGTIFANEDIGIALMRFNCYRVNVGDIPKGELRKKYEREIPAFYYFDPAATPLTKVSGKQARSLSTFSSHLEKTWAKSFTMKVKDFRKQMKGILDLRDKLEAKEKALEKKADRLFRRPSPSLRKQVEKEKAELAADEERIDEAEEALIGRCSLRAEYLPKGVSVEDQ